MSRRERPVRQPGVTPDGYDRIGPFHPRLAWVGVLLLDLLIVLVVLSAIAVAVDKTEDVVAPGGEEWLETI